MEAFVAAIILVGIAVMLRIIRLQAALFLIGVVLVALAFMSSAGKYAHYVPTWLFVAIAVILGINLLRAVFGVIFGKSAADGFTGKLLYGVFAPVLSGIGALLRTVFRIRP